ncbi:fibronectin type III domain-containing protein [Actinokineospora diospyrosa]|uniref:fibronectin type III domain-containing protein n=1 Tax=Actinokineospora diospyrosa TaxID=103728 RepID=UPI0020A2D21D|nr:fibronectin type III domain-containing protein [Actinokineospora diospyrosa]
MRPRNRLLAWGSAAIFIGAAVLVLRAPQPPPGPGPAPIPPPERVSRFAADDVVLPDPGAPPDTPRDLKVRPSPGRLVVSWAGAARATGYQVRWSGAGHPGGIRLVATRDTQLDGLSDGQEYRIEVRAVDGFGQLSAPEVAKGNPGPGDTSWRGGLSGLLDDFPDDSTLRADTVGSLWHLSGYRGCVDLGARATGEVGLPIDLGCGADEAVLRARRPIVLDESTRDGVLGRVAVLADAAGPGGRLKVDLVPGPADRVGSLDGTGTLPPGTVRAVVDDSGASVGERGAFVATPGPRGAGALHLFEVRVTRTEVTLSQDGRVVASSPVVPSWRTAWVLVGVRGPEGRRARVHIASAGFTGAATPIPQVVETPVNLATRQVLDPSTSAPSAGILRRPLVNALSARMVVTLVVSAGMDVSRVQIQLGTALLPAPPVVPTPPTAPGSVLTVAAEIPQALLGGNGSDSLSPLVVRAPGAGPGALVQESYLELVPGPVATVRTTTQPARTDRQRPTVDALPAARLVLGDSAGRPLPSPVVPAQGRLVLTVALSGAAAQWDTGGLEGVQGFQLWVDGRMTASLPTATNTGAPGGQYAIPVGLTGRAVGEHTVEVRVIGTSGARGSVLSQFTVA